MSGFYPSFTSLPPPPDISTVHDAVASQSPFTVMAVPARKSTHHHGSATRGLKPFTGRSTFQPAQRPKSKHSSCGPCRQRKSKCDRLSGSCSGCLMRGDQCYWEGDARPIEAVQGPELLPPLAGLASVPSGPVDESRILAELSHLRGVVMALCNRMGIDAANPWAGMAPSGMVPTGIIPSPFSAQARYNSAAAHMGIGFPPNYSAMLYAQQLSSARNLQQAAAPPTDGMEVESASASVDDAQDDPLVPSPDTRTPSLSIVTSPEDTSNANPTSVFEFGRQANGDMLRWYDQVSAAQKQMWGGPNSATGGPAPTSANDIANMGLWTGSSEALN